MTEKFQFAKNNPFFEKTSKMYDRTYYDFYNEEKEENGSFCLLSEKDSEIEWIYQAENDDEEAAYEENGNSQFIELNSHRNTVEELENISPWFADIIREALASLEEKNKEQNEDSIEYELKVWTKFNDKEPTTYKPDKTIYGDVNTLEKAQKFADSIISILDEFEPTKYEIIEKRVIFEQNLNSKVKK